MSESAGAQRFYRAPCPACGAPVEFKSAQSTHAICAYCQSMVVREGEVLKRIGKMAELFDDHSLLQLGASGQIDGQGFTLVGRLQYKYPEGTWTEWAALRDDGSTAWLSEDNGAYVFSTPVDSQREIPGPQAFRVGATTSMGGRPFAVAANTTAALIAAQGELPKLPPLGREFAVVELRSVGGGSAEGGGDERVFSIDYSSAPPALSSGRAVDLAALRMSGLKAESATESKGRQFACPNCGAPVLPKLEQSKSITCGQCNSLIDLSGGVGGELRHAEQDEPVRPLIPLGTVGTLEGTPWQVVGFQHRLGHSPSDEESFGWQEYLLYNARQGFCFLVDAEDGWSLVKPLTGAPQLSLKGDSATWQGTTYPRTWAYNAETSYVLGEFYWQVTRGQKTFNRDFAAGDKLLSQEQTGSESVWSGGTKLDASLVARAFKLDDKTALFKRTDANPLSANAEVNWVTVVIIVIVVVVLLALLARCSEDTSNNYSGTGSRSSGGSYGGYSSGGGHK